jgi:penicillin-binding protein 1A
VRIRDTYGISVDENVVRQAAFFAALTNSEADFIFENRLDEFKQLKKLHYGQGFDGFRAQIEAELGGRNTADSERQELYLRRKILGESFISLQALKRELDSYRKEVDEGENSSGLLNEPSGFNEQPRIGRLCYDKFRERYSYEKRDELPVNMVPVDTFTLQRSLLEQDPLDRDNFWKNVFIRSKVTLMAFEMLESQMDLELARLQKFPAYSFEVLSMVQDFRVLVGLQYLIELAHRLGVKSKLDPVLSFPLGSNVVTLLEAVRMYEGMVTGTVSVYGVQGDEDVDMLSVIDRIEDANGEVLYRPKKTTTHPVSAETSLAIGHILENVIKYGTGRYADKNVRMIGKDGKIVNMPIPLLGKTGTANMYTNASFFGYLPGIADQGGGMVLDGGYTVGTYVGFDDNKAMKHASTRVTGAVGALPAWTNIVNALLWRYGYGQQLMPAGVPSNGFTLQRPDLGQINVLVESENGGLVAKPAALVDSRYRPFIMTFGSVDDSGDFEPLREFKPCWRESSQENLQIKQ